MTHKLTLAAAMLIMAAAFSTSAWASWGCAYSTTTYRGITGRQWGHPNEQAARRDTMEACTSRKFKGCRVIGCSANVDSKEDADKLWAVSPNLKLTPCGGKAQEKCVKR